MTVPFLFTLPEPDAVRLVGGTSRCTGTLEIRRGVEWKAVSKIPGGYKFASRVCDKLDCGSVVSVVQQKRNPPATKWAIKNTCDGMSLADCSAIRQYTVNIIKITCSGMYISRMPLSSII